MTDDELRALMADVTPDWELLDDHNNYGQYFGDVDQGPANARLIAAAPDLAAEVLRLRAKEAAAEKLAEAAKGVSTALNYAFEAGTEEREGGSGRRQGLAMDRVERVRLEVKTALAAWEAAK